MTWFPPFCVSHFKHKAQCEFTEVNIETSTGEWGEEMSWTLYQSLEGGDRFSVGFDKGSSMGRHNPNIVFGRRLLLLLSVGLLGRWVERGRTSHAIQPLKVSLSLSPWYDGYEGYLAFQVGDGVQHKFAGMHGPQCLEPRSRGQRR